MGLPLHHPTASEPAASTQAQAQAQAPEPEPEPEPEPQAQQHPVPGGDDAARSGRLTKEEADRLYEEAMEEEYAKREGGC
ncbi:hypothetical protein UVI_02013860 [Ustilaginoidea virens]|uniref:Uncharacterized protein n=1 Tax=Ustilaginoidea virens TaxID=1159556 RepID=A0A1B5KRI7_USTVR|nr:hypothetical protein UVI_02013860 [Ustilaginoidea virens]